MRLIGLTGGIGSGKSTVARLLADRGAAVVDADAIAREVVEPGTPGFAEVVELFGAEIVSEDGTLDRAEIAARVFADAEQRAQLEAIVHPAVRGRISDRVAAHADTDDIVVIDSPLLVETGAHRGMDLVVVVTAKSETRVARLVLRGMAAADARARLAAQAPLEDKAAVADVVLDNEGSSIELERQVDRLWDDLAAAAG